MTLHCGDCLEVMPTLDAGSVDAVVTDPPYLLGFMGKEWDKPGRQGVDDLRERHPDPTGKSVSPFYRPGWGNSATAVSTRDSQVWHERWAAEAFRVAKPGAYLLAFGGTRTYHRMTCAIEDAGWIIRDCLVWAYASGFPKSKALLKPAWEPIVMARKQGPLRELAIDACRIAAPENDGVVWTNGGNQRGTSLTTNTTGEPRLVEPHPAGRWPANVLLTDPIFDGDTPGVVGGGWQSGGGNPRWRSAEALDGSYHGNFAGGDTGLDATDTEGTYSRFFLIPKAARSEREPVLGGLPQALTVQTVALGEMEYATYPDGTRRVARPKPRANSHPTVKPLDLMRHLVRLVTPTGGTVLDPFLGSGTTALAAEMEGFDWIGIEREPEYVAIAEARLAGTQRGLGLPA